jgi:hypothetical protein
MQIVFGIRRNVIARLGVFSRKRESFGIVWSLCMILLIGVEDCVDLFRIKLSSWERSGKSKIFGQ